MITSACGLRASTVRTVLYMWLRMRGNRRGMALKPMIEKSSTGRRLVSPAAAVDPGETQRHAGALLQGAHQRAAEPVAGLFHRHQENLDFAALRRCTVRAGAAHVCAAGLPASTPTTNSFARSAAAAIS